MTFDPRTLLSALSTPTPQAQSAVTAWLEQHRPALEEKARAILAPPFHVGEVYDLIGAVVTAASSGLSVLPGQDRKAVVKAVVGYLFTTYAAGKLPLALRFILTPAVLDGIVESIYQMLFKAQEPAPSASVTDAYVEPTRRPVEDGVTPTTDADHGPDLYNTPPMEK